MLSPANVQLQQARELVASRARVSGCMTRRELADLVNAYVWDHYRKRVQVDANYIGKLERGVICWPDPLYREALRKVLAVPTDDALGFSAPSRLPIAQMDQDRRPHGHADAGPVDYVAGASTAHSSEPVSPSVPVAEPEWAEAVEIALLGPVRARRAGLELAVGPPQQRATLAVLALAGGHSVSVDEIADALWREELPNGATSRIRTYVHRLRKILGSPSGNSVIVSRDGGYALPPARITLDVAAFERGVREAAASRGAGDLEAAAQRLHGALDLWQGTALAGLPGVFADTERQRLRQAWIAAAEELAAVELELGRHSEVVQRLTTAVAEEPWQERLHELFILALYRSGRQAEALAAYDKIRRLLRDELGADPGQGLRDLHQRMLHADPTLLTPRQDTRHDDAIAHPTPAQLPRDLPVFAGRRTQLDDLLHIPGELATVIIHGTAGVGKTALAVHWAHQVSQRFPDGQLYVNLRGFEADGAAVDPGEAVWWFLEALGVPGPSIPADPDARSALYRSVLADRRCLIVVDNACDAEQVLPLLPGGSGCLVLVTSRGHLPGLVAVSGARTITLDVLTEAEAHELLVRRVGAERVAAEPAAAGELIRLCGRLPLALAVICSRLASNRSFALAAVADELRQSHGTLDGFAGAGSSADVRTVLSWSYRALTSPSATLFRRWALNPGTDIGVPAAASLAGCAPGQAQSQLRDLVAAGLAVEPKPGRYGRHDLLGWYASELLDSHDGGSDRHDALARLLDHYLHTAYAAARLLNPPPDIMDMARPAAGTCPQPLAGYQEALDWFRAEHGTLLAVIVQTTEAGFLDHSWQLAWFMRHYLDRQGHWQDLTLSQHAALHAAQEAGNLTGMAYAHRGLARAEFNVALALPVDPGPGGLTDFGATPDPYESGKAGWPAQLGASGLSQPQTGRGQLPAELGREVGPEPAGKSYSCWDRVQYHLTEALTLFERQGDKLALAYTHRQGVFVRRRLGDHEAALTQAETALSLFRAAGESIGEATALVAVAWQLIDLDRSDEAIAHCRQAIAIYDRIGDDYDRTAALDGLGYAYHQLGRYDEAIDAYKSSIEHMYDLGDLRDIPATLLNLAKVYRAAGRPDKADSAEDEAHVMLTDLGQPDGIARNR